MVFGQKQLSFVFEVFGQIQSGNIVSDVLDRKKFCLDEKSQFSKKKIPRNQNFPKGLVYSFWPKMAAFLNGGFWAYPARKHRLFDILDTEECFLDNSEL